MFAREINYCFCLSGEFFGMFSMKNKTLASWFSKVPDEKKLIKHLKSSQGRISIPSVYLAFSFPGDNKNFICYRLYEHEHSQT